MKNLVDIKAEKQKKVSELIIQCSMFFAFSNEQFQENKTAKIEHEKYVQVLTGGYLPKSQVDNFRNGLCSINVWFREAIEVNRLRKEHIRYELINHEATYTNDIEDTLNALGPDYTADEVTDVLRSIPQE